MVEAAQTMTVLGKKSSGSGFRGSSSLQTPYDCNNHATAAPANDFYLSTWSSVMLSSS